MGVGVGECHSANDPLVIASHLVQDKTSLFFKAMQGAPQDSWDSPWVTDTYCSAQFYTVLRIPV